MPVEVYVEATGKRAFAGAMDWPGWCRAGRDEEAALEALVDYGARYARVLKGSGVRFTRPARASTLEVVERLKGDAPPTSALRRSPRRPTPRRSIDGG